MFGVYDRSVSGSGVGVTCEGCLFFHYTPGGQIDDPYPAVWCGKGHWDGGPMPEPGDKDVWADCKDFVKNES